MSLSSLPWFVRSEVINLIIAELPEYCSINREWMRQVAIQHGEVYLTDGIPESRPISPFAPYIERISFNRSTNIDWDVLFLYKNLKHVDIRFYFDDVNNFKEFTSKLERLPPLSSLQLQITESQKMDLFKVLRRGKDHLMRLELTMDSIEWYPSNLVLSRLKYLHLVGTKSQFSVQEITRNMPNLNQLSLNCDISFTDEVMPNILELDVTSQHSKPNTKLELSLFPQLKYLKLNGLLITSIESNKNRIESLTINGTADQVMQVVNIPFPNLKVLDLSDNEINKFQGLVNLFQYLTTLSTLTKFKLKIRREIDLPVNLSEGPYSFTDLTLQGPFLITPPSLTWLSNCFNLTHLNLKFCNLKDDVTLPIVPFKSLDSLEITSRSFYFDQFKAYFNKIHYPHIESIELDKIDFCDMWNPFYQTS